MHRRLFLQLSVPAAIVGLLMFVGSVASVWSIQRLQGDLSNILTENVTSLEAAQDLVIQFRQLRFHTLLNVMEPRPVFQELIEKDHTEIEATLKIAHEHANVEGEKDLVDEIERRYIEYRRELEKDSPIAKREGQDYIRWIEDHRIRPLSDPCRDLFELNKKAMYDTSHVSERTSRQVRLAVLLVGILGPISGLLLGYVISRSWSRSIAQLRVRLHDMHAQLDKDVGELKFDLGSNWLSLDRQLDNVVAQVKEAAAKLQRQQQAILRSEQLAAVGQLAASVAHEIRNPLTSIKMLIGAALRPETPQDLSHEDLTVIYDEIGKLEVTVHTLLDHAKPTEIRKRAVDVRGVLTQAANLIRSRAERQQVAIDVDVPAGETIGSVDPNQLGVVLVNLLVNSLDAMPQGGTVNLMLDASDPTELEIRVSDTGPGVAPQIRGSMFDPFVSTKATGTGLGLSICLRIVRDHGGSIRYESPPSGGARFIISLPQVQESVHAAPVGRR